MRNYKRYITNIIESSTKAAKILLIH